MPAKILIVDDEPNVLRLIGYALQVEGYEIIVAKDGVEALTKVQMEQPDLVILDVMLPSLSGIDICQQLRSRSETTTLPIIMFSARVQVADKIEGFKAGADDYLTKPIAPDELVARVGALLERTERLRQASPVNQGKIFGVIGAKGGVGTTTVALNMASAWAMDNKRTIAVELRSNYGTFSAALKLTPAENLAGLRQLDLQHISRRDVANYLTKHQSGLQLLCGPQKITDYQPIEASQTEAILEKLASLADYVVLDLPTATDDMTRTALRHCDTILVTIEPDAICTTAARALLALLRSWGISNAAIKIIIINKRSLAMEPGALKAHLDCEIIGVVPPALDIYYAAQARGLSMVQFRPQDMVARQFIEITAGLTGPSEAVLVGSLAD
jgi:DNA-binding response OmpR family regulator